MTSAIPIQIAAKLLECRDAHRRIFGETFDAVTKDYRDLILAVAEKRKAGLLETALGMAEQMEAAGKGQAVPLFIAAAVELIEPSRASA